MIPTRIIIGAVLALAAIAAVLGYGEFRAHNAAQAEAQRWEAAVNKLKSEAAQALAAETRKVLEVERRLSAMTLDLEAEHAQRKALSDDFAARLRAAAARNGGRLRDPNARGCRADGGRTPAPDTAGAERSTEDGSQGGGLLSSQLTQLLRDQARIADEVNNAYAQCRAWALDVRRIIEEDGERGVVSPLKTEAANQPSR
jgi:hypothetical protein